jgi:hypothetical protein
MRTTDPHAEQARDEEIAEIGAKLLAAWHAKLLAGDRRAISDLHNCVLDRLTEDEAKQLFIDAVTGKGGDAFNVLAAKVMADTCEIEAIKQVERAEQFAEEEARYDRIEQRVFARYFAQEAA